MDSKNLHKYSNAAIRDHYELPISVTIIRDVHRETALIGDKWRSVWVGMIGGERITVQRDTEFPGEHFIVFRPSTLNANHFKYCDKYSKQKNRGKHVHSKAGYKARPNTAKSQPRKQKASS